MALSLHSHLNCHTVPLFSTYTMKRFSKMASLLKRVLGRLRAERLQRSFLFPKFPREIIFEILNLLELHDLFTLGQTCQAFRRITQRDWELYLSRLSPPQQLEFWTGLAFGMPSHWVCGPCRRLHKIDKNDLPGRCYNHGCPHEIYPTLGHTHRIGERHVQLALKFTRLKNVQDYLESIMTPFTDKKGSSNTKSLCEDLHVSPRIVTEGS